MVQSWGTLALVVVGSGTKWAGLLLVSSFDWNSYADEPKVTGPSACRPASSALLGFQPLAGRLGNVCHWSPSWSRMITRPRKPTQNTCPMDSTDYLWLFNLWGYQNKKFCMVFFIFFSFFFLSIEDPRKIQKSNETKTFCYPTRDRFCHWDFSIPDISVPWIP